MSHHIIPTELIRLIALVADPQTAHNLKCLSTKTAFLISKTDLLEVQFKYHLATHPEQCFAWAIQKNHVKLLPRILSNPASRPSQIELNKALGRASGKGDADLVINLLSVGADFNYKDGDAVRLAALRGHEKVVAILLDAGSPPSMRALSVAAQGGHCGVLSQLIAAGVDLSDPFGDNAFLFAAQRNHVPVLALLISHGINNDLLALTRALNYAAELGHVETVAFILKQGLNLEILGRAALISAAQNGFEKILDLLLPEFKRQDVTVQAQLDMALLLAVSQGNYKGITSLVGAGADAGQLTEKWGGEL